MAATEYERLPPGTVRDPEAMDDCPPQIWGPDDDEED
ncbi:hypothetical protein S1361_06525 [Streptomyces cyanogenus]|uniref:Uncharacterized protein n=1 Tax=Streptomyces cyanogenus TaxID=80860 RepID=A0ABX7TJZ3_STRCY|nr:hypothetical protein S1361_06525 [Streptomyces cyanogenus]